MISLPSLGEASKTIITAVGLIVALATEALPAVTDLSPQGAHILSAIIGIGTVILNYAVPNETTNPARAVGRSVRLKGEKPLKVNRHEASPTTS